MNNSRLVVNETAVVENKIVKRDGKWYVYSEDGSKKLGGPYDSRGAAEKRLGQVEYFKSNQFTQVNLQFATNKASLRHEQLEGREYLVAPCVMLTEGVHGGSQGPLYYPSEELAKTPEVWNGKPVVVYHPKANGRSVSACDPIVYEKQKIGTLFNTVFKDGKLKTECWIDAEKARAVDDRVSAALESGAMMEVSTGLYTDNEHEQGTWNGEEYVAIARGYRPDHLALLPDQVGACSIADGAGLLRNEKAASNGTPLALQALGESISVLARGAGRGQGGPRQGDGGTDSCVCPNCGHTASHERGTPCTNVECPKCGSKMVGSSTIRNAVQAFHDAIQNELSHSDVRYALEVKVSSAGAKDIPDAWVTDVFDDFFIYEKGGKTWYQEYKVKDDEVMLEGVRKEATKVTKYKLADGEMVGNTVQGDGSDKKGKVMDKEKIVNSLISNEKSPWTEDNREMLMGMSEEQLQVIVGNQEEKGNSPASPAASPAPAAEPTGNAAPAVAPKKEEEGEVTVEQFISNAPEGMRDVLRSGLASHRAEKAKLIASITANKRNPFTAEQLNEKGLEELRGIAQLAQEPQPQPKSGGVNYVGLGEPAPVGNQDQKEEPLTAPVMNFGKEE